MIAARVDAYHRARGRLPRTLTEAMINARSEGAGCGTWRYRPAECLSVPPSDTAHYSLEIGGYARYGAVLVRLRGHPRWLLDS